jgi:hypothetical protein
MSRRWIAGLATVAAVGGAAVAVASGGNTDDGGRPTYATVSIDLSGATATTKRGISGTTKPRVVYLQGPAEPINPAPIAAGGIGPYIDVKLTGCTKVIDGGVVPDNTDVYLQGSYVKSKSEYHVLIGLDDEAVSDPAPDAFTVRSNLTCLKGVK